MARATRRAESSLGRADIVGNVRGAGANGVPGQRVRHYHVALYRTKRGRKALHHADSRFHVHARDSASDALPRTGAKFTRMTLLREVTFVHGGFAKVGGI